MDPGAGPRLHGVVIQGQPRLALEEVKDGGHRCGVFGQFLPLAEPEDDRQQDIYDLAEKKGTVQFLAGVNTRHGPQPATYPSTTEVNYVAALKKADVDGMVAGLEKDIDQLQDRLDQFNHDRRIEVDGRILELAS